MVGQSRKTQALGPRWARFVGGMAFAVGVLGGCVCPPQPQRERILLRPPLRVFTPSGLLRPVLRASPSFLCVDRPELAELVVQCRKEPSYERRWAFPAVLVNLVTLLGGYFTFTFRCTATLTGHVVGTEPDGTELFRFEDRASATRTFFQYQKRPEPDDPALYPGFEMVHRLARQELARRISYRITEEWAKRAPARALRTVDLGS